MSTPLGRPTLSVASQLDVPVGSVDVVPSVAAARWPNRAALRAGVRSVTFAELNRDVSRLAFGLRQLIGGDGLTVAVSATLGLDFPTAFYAIARSGNVAAPVNPRMPAEVFRRLLETTDTRAAVLDRVMYERVRPVLATGRLEEVVLLDAPAETGVLTCAELATGGGLLVEPRDRDENEPAAIMLDQGHLPTASLTHLELKTAAARAALADGLTETAVVLNALPAYQPTHLGAGVHGGATQVLWRGADQAAVGEAHRNGATHLQTAGGTVRIGRAATAEEAIAS